MSRNPYTSATKVRKKKSKKKDSHLIELEEWRTYYREAGPVEFSEKELACPPDVPPHPDLGRVPDFIILSDDQKKFLIEISSGLIDMFILAASRGAGKTFIFAAYACWRIACFDDFTMTVMGGTGEQSEKIKEYIDFWRIRNDKIGESIPRSVASGNKPARVMSRWNSYARFPACSDASARGPHVTQLFIDEVCAGEAKGKGGAAAIRSSRYQLTSSSNSLLGMSSTAQFILGTFYETWTNSEDLGYIRYRWSIAKHKSASWFTRNPEGELVPNWLLIDEILYKDRNPDNWEPNVWWMSQKDIINLRKNSTDDEWLVEMLGGISRGSGLVFSRDDLAQCICNGEKYTDDGEECYECDPYTVNCPMMRRKNLDLSMIGERRGGADFGEVAPNAFTTVGSRDGIVYVLYSDERTGLREDENYKWMGDTGTNYSLYYIFADPANVAGREALENRGFNCPHIWAGIQGDAKQYYVVNGKRFVEQHILFIPKKFDFLVRSMRGLAYDDRGRIRKHNDHSWDSLMYAMSDYNIDDFLQIYLGKIKTGIIGRIW